MKSKADMVTKDYLEDELHQLEANITTKFEAMFTEFSSLFFSAIDPLVKDLEVRREDRESALTKHPR